MSIPIFVNSPSREIMNEFDEDMYSFDHPSFIPNQRRLIDDIDSTLELINSFNDTYDENTFEENQLFYANLKKKLSGNRLHTQLNIESQKAKYVHTTETCCICISNFVADEDIIILECGHILHKSCGTEMLKYKSLCPLCRAPINSYKFEINNQDDAHFQNFLKDLKNM